MTEQETSENSILKVLVVEDDEGYREQARDLVDGGSRQGHLRRLGYSGYEFLEAETPEKGRKLLGQNPDMDLVLLDINFRPSDWDNKDGIEKFLIPERANGLKTIVICWSSSDDYEHTSREEGADGFIKKSREGIYTHKFWSQFETIRSYLKARVVDYKPGDSV